MQEKEKIGWNQDKGHSTGQGDMGWEGRIGTGPSEIGWKRRNVYRVGEIGWKGRQGTGLEGYRGLECVCPSWTL